MGVRKAGVSMGSNDPLPKTRSPSHLNLLITPHVFILHTRAYTYESVHVRVYM